MRPTVYLVYDENLLTVVNTPPALEREVLTYTEHQMVRAPEFPHPLVSTKTEEKIFDFLTLLPHGGVVIQTWQGMWKRVLQWLTTNGYTFEWHDARKEFPEPKYKLMHGFRFSQKLLLTTALQQGFSGLIGAPTRFGKTTLLINTLRAFPDVCTVVTVPGVDVVKQLFKEIKEALPQRDVLLLGAGSTRKYPSDDITVCSMDSLHLCDHGRVRLLLIDEPHALPTTSRLEEFGKFDMARRIGYGATLKGRYDRRDILIEGVIGPVLVERTYQEAVAEGAICQIKTIMIRMPFYPPRDLRDRAAIYKRLLFENPDVAAVVKWICHELVPEDWQTLMFIKNENSAEFFLKAVGEAGTIAMAKRLTAKGRRELTDAMKDSSIRRCIASDIYAQGVTFHHIRALINLASGGPYTGTVQKPGRLAEVRPGKRCGVMFDFMFVANDGDNSINSRWGVVRESWQRYAVYQEKGYDIAQFNADDRAGMRKYLEDECT